ncbi:MAG: hypothetical protein ABIO83_01610 [Ilumatobacteraceae bacterium]
MHRVEFTIEPFVEGHPGPHVTESVIAVEALGVEVEIGPFGSSCLVEQHRSDTVVAAVVRTAFDHGATFVNLAVSTEDVA